MKPITTSSPATAHASGWTFRSWAPRGIALLLLLALLAGGWIWSNAWQRAQTPPPQNKPEDRAFATLFSSLSRWYQHVQPTTVPLVGTPSTSAEHHPTATSDPTGSAPPTMPPIEQPDAVSSPDGWLMLWSLVDTLEHMDSHASDSPSRYREIVTQLKHYAEPWPALLPMITVLTRYQAPPPALQDLDAGFLRQAHKLEREGYDDTRLSWWHSLPPRFVSILKDAIHLQRVVYRSTDADPLRAQLGRIQEAWTARDADAALQACHQLPAEYEPFLASWSESLTQYQAVAMALRDLRVYLRMYLTPMGIAYHTRSRM